MEIEECGPGVSTGLGLGLSFTIPENGGESPTAETLWKFHQSIQYEYG